MKRAPLLLGLVAFIVADVVLVTLAFRSAQGEAPPDTAPPPRPSAAEPTDSAPPTKESAEPEANRGRPLLLAAGNDGTVLRAQPGSCDGPAAEIALSRDGGQSFDPRQTEAQVVLRLSVTSLADMWMAGLNTDCEPTFYRSGDGGRSWRATAGTQGAWHLLPSDDATLHGPDGNVETPCAPVALSAVSFQFAAAGCANGAIITSDNRGNQWQTRGFVPDVVDIAFVGPQRGFALSVGGSCPAQISGTTDGGQTWQQLSCIDGPGPGRAIALADGALLVQTGRGQVHRSEDDGASWQRA